MSGRPEPEVAARSIIEARFPEATAAILTGSVVTGRATAASDLDIVVLIDDPRVPWRASFLHEGWPVELFVHSEVTVRRFWELPDERVRPALAAMCARGTLLWDRIGAGARVQADARALLDAGPPRSTPEELDRRRYALTDALDDLLADPGAAELPFIVCGLTASLVELAMDRRGAFRGTGKWVYRMAEDADPVFATRLSSALDAVARGNRTPLAELVREELDAVGGPLFEGYEADGRSLLEAP